MMRIICLFWTLILLGNYRVRADEDNFQLLNENQTGDKSNFYNIINYPNNSVSWSDNKTSGVVRRSLEDIIKTIEETSNFTEHESESVVTSPDDDNPDFINRVPFQELHVPGNVWTPPSELDDFRRIPDDLFKDSSNVIIVTMEIPNFDDEYYKPVTYRSSNVSPWLKVFGIIIALMAAAYGTYLRCTRKREVTETSSDDISRTVILIVPKTEKV